MSADTVTDGGGLMPLTLTLSQTGVCVLLLTLSGVIATTDVVTDWGGSAAAVTVTGWEGLLTLTLCVQCADRSVDADAVC